MTTQPYWLSLHFLPGCVGAFSKPYRWGATLLVCWFLFFIGILFPAFSFAKNVAIISSGNLSVYQQAIAGFRSALPASIHVQEYVLGQPMIDDRTIGQQIRGADPDVVLAVGGKAALLAKIEIVDQPVVFCMVLNPDAFGLPAANMTGVLMTIKKKEPTDEKRSTPPVGLGKCTHAPWKEMQR